MRLLHFAVPALLALPVCALLAQPATAGERSSSRSPHSRQRAPGAQSGDHSARNPWDWHPGMAGDADWSRDYAQGRVFGFDRGGWSWGYRDGGWGAYYDDGNLRLQYSQGAYYLDRDNCRRAVPWRQNGLCQGCGNQLGYCCCDYGGGCGDGYGGGYYGRQHVIVFGPGQGHGYDRAPGDGDPLYVDGQPVYPPGGDVYYDNSVTNNYYGDAYSAGGAGAPPARGSAGLRDREEKAGRAARPTEKELLPTPRPYGSLLYERLRLKTPDGEREFLLKDGQLSAGPLGEAGVVAQGVDMIAGAYALVEPGLGTSLIYMRDGVLYGAFQTAKGQWYAEALPLGVYANGTPVRVAGELSLGLVGAEMWASFSADDGARYLFVWERHAWREIGSARRF